MNHSTPVPMTFESASAFWIAWCNLDVEAADVGDQFQTAEQVILSHEAKSLEETAAQLSVVIDAMIGGGRSDGLDVEVVRRAQVLIREVGRLAPALTVSPAPMPIWRHALARPCRAGTSVHCDRPFACAPFHGYFQRVGLAFAAARARVPNASPRAVRREGPERAQCGSDRQSVAVVIDRGSQPSL